MNRVVRAWLAASALLLTACQEVQPCSNDELRRGVAEARALRDGHPLRIGDGRSVPGNAEAARSMREACPHLPVLGLDLDREQVGDASLRHYGAAVRQTCTDIDAALTAQNDARATGAPWGAGKAAFYDACDFGRFDLVALERFQLSHDGLTGFMAYDHMLRQGADRTLAAELAGELFWHSPWMIAPELLPSVQASHGAEGGVGLRITAQDVLVPTAIDEAIARVQPQLEAHDADLPARLMLVADADVSVATLSALASRALERGADAVFVMVTEPHGDAVFVPFVSRSEGPRSAGQDLCVDTTSVWSSVVEPAPTGLLAGTRAAAWRRVADDGLVLGAANGRIAMVRVMPSVELERLLMVSAAIEQEREYPDRAGAERILYDATVRTCEEWVGVLAAARVDAEGLQTEWTRCETRGGESPTARQLRERATCMRAVCEHATRHAETYATLPDGDDRRADATRLCARASARP